MTRYVVKFGGTSLANIDRIQRAAGIVAGIVSNGKAKEHEIVVVVSAMAGMTNQLVNYANMLNTTYTSEHDVVIASGEQITAGLMALALQKLGLKSQSLLAYQIAIQTCESYGNAEITDINTQSFEDHFQQGCIPVAAGFQGVTQHKRITTLGRGGSDTTAVALAAALKADSCIIYTDVEGIFTADPRVVPNAQKIDTINYLEMLELARQGAKVLHARSVEMGMQHRVDLYVRSSFVDKEGTHITTNQTMPTISGIAHSLNEIHIHISGTPKQLNKTQSELKKENISIDLLTTHNNKNSNTTCDFTISKNDVTRTQIILSELKSKLSFDVLAIDPNIVKISIVGFAVKFDPTLESHVSHLLLMHNINVHLMSRIDIKLSLIVAHNQMTKAMGILHDALIKKNKPN